MLRGHWDSKQRSRLALREPSQVYDGNSRDRHRHSARQQTNPRQTIIKDLTAQNMSANSPTKLITILLKPDVTFELAVEIIDLKARVIRLVICMDLSRTDKKALEGRN